MKISFLNKNLFNIQKLFVSDCEFLKENYGSYCIVSKSECKFLVKLGLYHTKCVNETVFLDDSVILFNSFSTILASREIQNISINDIEILNQPSDAKSINIIIVFDDIFDVKEHKTNPALNKIIADILKLFIICSNSVVFFSNLPPSQRFGICCVIVTEIENASSRKIFRVTSSTKIHIEKCICRSQLQQTQAKENKIKIGGCQRVYDVLRETIDFAKEFKKINIKVVRKLLLVGPSGCGKTTLIQNLALDCECILLEILPSDINSLTVKHLEKKFDDIFNRAKLYSESKVCCIILIEDIDLMSVGKTSHSKQFVRHLINFLEELENVPGVVVIATSNSPELVDLQLRKPRRLEDELEIMIPTAEEREEILHNILNYCKIHWDDNVISQVAKWTPGFVGADLRLLVLETLMMIKHQENDESSESQICQKILKQALTKVIPSALKGTLGLFTTKNTSLSDLGGLENIKKILDLSINQQLNNLEKFQKLGVPLTKGILLYGPPGCAKTSLVKALAKECNTTFLATSAADLYSPFVGDAEKKIVQLFAQARIGSPSILFIDEIDAVVGSKSGERERGVQERILSTLLIEMDGVGLKVNTQRDSCLNSLATGVDSQETFSKNEPSHGVIVVGATNRPQLLDDALKRPGRFDRLLYIPPPDESERFQILKKLTERTPLHESVDLKHLAKLTNFYSGADLKNLCQETGLHALKCSNMTADCIEQSHFEFILKEYKPSLSQKILDFYESFQKYNS